MRNENFFDIIIIIKAKRWLNMATFKSAIGLMLAIVMYITNGISAFIPGIITDPVSEDELPALINNFDDVPLANEIIVVESGKVSFEERAAIQSLQGLIARTEAKIFINYGMDSKSELQDLKDNGYPLSYTDENGNYWIGMPGVTKFA